MTSTKPFFSSFSIVRSVPYRARDLGRPAAKSSVISAVIIINTERADKTDAPPEPSAALAIAGLWRPGEGNHPPSFTMLTTEPGPDVEPYHNRQVVVLRPENWTSWLDLSRPEGEILQPLPAGSLAVETVRSGSD